MSHWDNRKCGWCGTIAHMSPAGQVVIHHDIHAGQKVACGPFKCAKCGRMSIGVHLSPGRNVGTYGMDTWHYDPPHIWSPTYVEGQDFEDVPEHIAVAAGEAYKSSSIGNDMSAILMARTVIEATAKDRGITSGSLAAKIDAMEAAGLIRAHVRESAHEVRHFGNDMAHGDITVQVEVEDVAEVLALMNEILNEVYQGPARLEKVRARRLARNGASGV